MRTLRDLLTTWENWSAREVNRRALANARTEREREAMRDALGRSDEVAPLEVLRDMTELVTLLAGWRWQAVQSAREQGATWTEIGAATGVKAEQAEIDHADAIARQASYGPGSSRR